MSDILRDIDQARDEGFNAGYKAGWLDGEIKAVSQQPYGKALTPHDLDTLAMGLALVVLHAADIQTIAATMDTQQKLGVAEKVLGWLHLIAHTTWDHNADLTLHETAPNPWLNPYIQASLPNVEAELDPALADWRKYKNQQKEADDEIPF